MKYLLLFTCSFIPSILCCQELSGEWKSPIIGTSFTYIWDPEAPSGHTGDYLMQEYTWSLNLSYPISRRFTIGADSKIIRLQSELSSPDSYYMAGVFTQLNITPQTTNRLFAQVNFMLGNYCTCGYSDPYKESLLQYGGLGLGWNIKLFRNLYLDLAFENFIIFNSIEDKYNFTQYIIGLDYHI